MYDPLNEGGFGSDDLSPGWPTTPHPATGSIPNMPRASLPGTPRATTPQPPGTPRTPSSATAGDLRGPAFPNGREPQIYGQPESGLLSPQATTGANGTKFEKNGAYLRLRITGLDRNRRDVLIRFDAQTNLSNFTGTTYRNVQRSYLEFQQLAEALSHSCPQTITPALPFAQTSAPTDEEDDRLVKIMLQRWCTRICEDPILLRDEELRAFVESDFGYQPTPRPKRKTGSGFSLIRRGVPDEDEELQKARFELTKLEGQFFEAAKAVDKLIKSRKALAVTHSEMGNKLFNVATTEAHPHLANALRKVGRTWHSLADLDQAQAISECVILGDSLGYQGLNSRAAKETLQMRTSVLEEYQAAVKSTISKRRNIERLKASSNIRPERVDEALEEMGEANKYEKILHQRADGISQNLHRALASHRGLVTDDVMTALIEHTRSSVMYEKQLLRELEALRPDIDNATSNAPVVPTNVAATPRPLNVPRLEEYDSARFRPQQPLAPQPQSQQPPLLQQSFLQAAPNSQSQPQLPRGPLSAAAHAAPLPPTPGAGSASVPQSPGLGPASPSIQSPAAATSVASNGPPLGGRIMDGTQSMFITPTPRAGLPITSIPRTATLPPSPLPQTGLPASSTAGIVPGPGLGPVAKPMLDPISSPGVQYSDPLSGLQSNASPLGPPLSNTTPTTPSGGMGGIDPLGGMSASMMVGTGTTRLSHGRSRLDAREAASKLANAF